MMINKPESMVRFGLVFLTGIVITWNYETLSFLIYFAISTQSVIILQNLSGSFSHFVHHPRHFPFDHHDDEHPSNDNDHHHHGSPFEGIYLSKDFHFLEGLALPLLLLTLGAIIWKSPRASRKQTTTEKPSNYFSSFQTGGGDVNMKKWTVICFLMPLLLVMLDGASEHYSQKNTQMNWTWIDWFFTSLMSPTGYAAVWALAAFLIPVSKHSPILDWLQITPIQALTFHRLAGWTSLWASIAHGFLHLRHLMHVLNWDRPNPRPWYQELWILLVPPDLECVFNQDPFAFLSSNKEYQNPHEHEGDTCWLALINATGMISVIAFVVLAITSLPQIRRSSYNLFYMVHIPTAWIMLITAIWHYPTCALVLIPNILYYLSFNVPILVTQTMDMMSKKKDSSPIIEANLIQGGALELVFATEPQDHERHESRFVKIFHPSLSITSHPFSIFSPQYLRNTTENVNELTIHSILLRPTGQFTKSLIQQFFPDIDDVQDTAEYEDNPAIEPLISQESSTASSSSCHKLQFDSYYAGSFDWIDHAMLSHDEILLVAGGVGIVPFLKFLPSLYQRILSDTAARSSAEDETVGNDSLNSNTASADSTSTHGPSKIYLHWYCREVGLASYIWSQYLYPHTQTWESNSTCNGRLKINIHITSLDPNNSSAPTEDTLSGLPRSGLVEKYVNPNVIATEQPHHSVDSICPVKDARSAQSWLIGLLLPGCIMLMGILFHWWWYKQVIINDEFREGNLIMRSHSVIFTLLLAIVVSTVWELVNRFCRINDTTTSSTRASSSSQYLDVEQEDGSTMEIENGSGTHPSYLHVSKGRPSMEDVITPMLEAESPGVYLCGPHLLMESIKDSIGEHRKDCAIYREDSEI